MRLSFVNDVFAWEDDSSILIGQADPLPTDTGNRQALLVAQSINKNLRDIDCLLTSGAKRLSKLLHNLRGASTGYYLLRTHPKTSKNLLERSFGVLQGTQHSFSSDIFTHTRICPEGGESIAQCRDRVIQLVQDHCTRKEYRHILMLSHPFLCQVLCNFLARQTLTRLTNFWMHKGSYVTFKLDDVGWCFEFAYNALVKKSYSSVGDDVESIYNNRQFVGKLDA